MSKTRVPRRPAATPLEEEGVRINWRAHAWRLALLWILLAGAYSNSFDAGLVFDNKPVISEDPRIQAATAQNTVKIFRTDYWYQTGTSGLYRPITTLSYLFNYAILDDGVRPLGYHAVNLALHAANASLLYFLGLAIFGDPASALVLAAIWGLHPLATEAVTNIVGRADLLAALGVLAGLLFHVKARRWNSVVGIALAQALGIFSKENAIVLPALILLYDVSFRPRKEWRLSPYVACALPIALFFAMRAATHPHFLINFPENPLVSAGFWAARLTALRVIANFLWLFVWPVRLSADYSFNAVPIFGSGGWEDVKTLLSAAMLLGVITAWLVSFKRAKPMFFFLGLFWIALLPTANLLLLIGAIMAERFIYLSMVGLCGCVVVGLKWFAGRGLAIRPVWAGVAVACLALAARTYARNEDWRDGLALWTSAAEVNPNSARAHNNLGYEIEQIPGRGADAVAEYQAALRIRPDYPEAYYNLGNALARMSGRLPDAISAFQSAVKFAPRYAEAHNNLGSVLVESGRLPEAMSEFQAALRIRPEFVEAHLNLANALASMPGQLEAAIVEYRAATRLRPDHAEAHNNLGNALAQLAGHRQEAIAEYQTSLRIKPDYAEAHANLGSAFFASGDMEGAIREYEAAIRLDPQLADAHFNLAQALLRDGRRAQAIAELEAAERIRPDAEVRQMLKELEARR